MNTTPHSALATRQADQPHLAQNRLTSKGRQILVVGLEPDVFDDLKSQQHCNSDNVRYCAANCFRKGAWQESRPDLVVAPLLHARIDALEMAQQLENSGFTGGLEILIPNLPRPGVVQLELQAAAPSLNITLRAI